MPDAAILVARSAGRLAWWKHALQSLRLLEEEIQRSGMVDAALKAGIDVKNGEIRVLTFTPTEAATSCLESVGKSRGSSIGYKANTLVCLDEIEVSILLRYMTKVGETPTLRT